MKSNREVSDDSVALQRDWARSKTHDAVVNLAKESGGSYGLGLLYAKTLFGGSPKQKRLLRRTFDFDMFVCVRCGGRRRVLASVKQAARVRAIRAHLGLLQERERRPPGGRRQSSQD